MRRNVVTPRQTSLASPEIVNPFVHKLKLSCLDKLQVAIMSVTVAPLRFIITLLIVLLLWFLALLSVAFLSEEGKRKPFSHWRRCFQRPIVALGRAMFFVIGFHRIKIKGKRAPVQEAPVLVAAPHSSFFDFFLFILEVPLLSPVSRSENANLFMLGKLIMFSQPVLVNRRDPNSRASTIKEIQERTCSESKWPQILIFPEGTCTNRSCLISFKPGAFLCGVPVQPVCVRYPNKLDTVSWVQEGPGGFTQLWLTMCQFYTRCEVEYLPVYVPSETEKTNPRLYANNVRSVMKECLNIPVTDHTYEDCMLMTAAETLSMPARVGLVEFEKLHSKLGIRFDEMRNLLNKFNEIKKNRSGKQKASSITYDEFQKYLMLPECEALRQVFDLYDRDGSGTIDFREYVIGLSLVSSPVNNNDTIELAFELFDTDNNGFISRQELQNLLGAAFSISQEDADMIFDEVNLAKNGKITMDEFKNYAMKKPEYAKIFTTYREIKLKERRKSMERMTLGVNYAADFDQWGAQVDDSIQKLD